MAAKDRYESLKDITRAVTVLLWIDVASHLLYSIATIAFIAYLGELVDIQAGKDALDAGLHSSELAQGLLGLVGFIFTVTLFFLIGRWLFRAAWNVRHLGAKRLEFTPGWAVGWYFIPFANLVYPYRSMKETWLASHDPQGWRPSDVSVVSLWWGLWLGTTILGNVSFRLWLRAETVEAVRFSEWLGLVGSVLAIPLALVFIRIVRAITAAQDQHAATAVPAVELPASP